MSASDDQLLDATLTLQKLRVSAADESMLSPAAAGEELSSTSKATDTDADAAAEEQRSPPRRHKMPRHERAPLGAHSRSSSSESDGAGWMMAPSRPSLSPPSDLENAPPPRAPTYWPRWSYDWDLPALGNRQASGRTRILLLIRHGQYDTASPYDELRVLTPLGRAQATATGHRLRARLAALGCEPPRTIMHSTMKRAVETAQLIQQVAFPEAMLLAEPALREGAPCTPDPDWWHPSDADVRRDGPRIEGAFKRYFHRDVADAPSSRSPLRTPLLSVSTGATASSSEVDDDASSHRENMTAAAPAPAEAAAPDAGGAAPSIAPPNAADGTRSRCEIIVCHGNVIRYCALRALQLPPEAWLRLMVPNASITTVSITADGDALLSGLGDAGHLPAQDVTA